MNTALYRKYRSRSLDEIVGQSHITSLLRTAISQNKTSHAYLLTGPRGVGKTSIARIIAHEINGLDYNDESQHLDIIEIDAASNNGVEDVRELREKVHIAPSVAAKKIYIIDEVHMLSKPAFNALLKTLEEPPEHVVFIMATTDADKLPATIISRVQRFNFRSITIADAIAHLRKIANSENINIDTDALELIARAGRGSFRDSIGLLDQLQHVSHTNTISALDVQKALGYTSEDTVATLLSSMRSGGISAVAEQIAELERAGVQPAILTEQLIEAIRREISLHPDELNLLNDLLDVAASSHPYIKLLSILALQSRPSVAIANTPAPQQSATKHAPEKSPEKAPRTPAPASKKITSESPSPANTTPNATPPGPESFDIKTLIANANGDVALKSLLAKCEYQLQGNELTIFAASKFNAGRLKSTKQLPKLHSALSKAGYDQLTLVISDQSKPPADSQLASVAAIMGGGTEVEINDGS